MLPEIMFTVIYMLHIHILNFHENYISLSSFKITNIPYASEYTLVCIPLNVFKIILLIYDYTCIFVLMY